MTCYLHVAYSAIRESYDDILTGGDDLRVSLKRTRRRLSSYVYALFAPRDLVLQKLVWKIGSARHLLHDALIDSLINEAFLQCNVS